MQDRSCYANMALQHTVLITTFVTVVISWMLTCVNADTKHAYRHDRADSNVKTTDHESCAKHSDDGDSCEVLNESQEDVSGKFQWDPKGYVMFCPCMGRLGNQGEHYLGAMAFAKALDRTLVLPPFRTFSHASFGELFQVEPLQEFHRTILMEDFMKHLAPKYWPPGKRSGYSHVSDKNPCVMKVGNPFGPFWDHFSIDFDDCTRYQIHNFADVSNERSMRNTKQEWSARFSPQDHPVLALRGSPGSYPMLAGNRDLQKYLRWSPAFFADAGKYIEETFRGEGYVGIHLRNGIDWERGCEHADGLRRFMASPQCLEQTPGVVVSKDLCLPSLTNILELASQVFKQVNAKHLYIATDNQPHTDAFKKLLQPLGVSVHHLNPHLAEMDLMVLGQADFFIGNCVSSFTSFVKRERDVNGKPSAFWGQELDL